MGGRSIRRRLVLLVGGGAVTLAVASGLATGLLFEARLARALDRELADKARLLAALSEQEGEKVLFEFVSEMMPESRSREGGEYFEVWIEGEDALARSESLGTDDLPRQPGRSSEPRFSDLVLPDGRPGRAVQVDYEPRLELEIGGAERVLPPHRAPPGLFVHPMTLVVAVGTEGLRQAVDQLRVVVVAVFLSLVVGLTLLIRWAVGRGLEPVANLADRVAAADPASAAVRFASRELPREIAPLAERLDELVARLESAVDRERLFSSNVAHELRTPVAELRGLAEVAQRFPEERAAIEGFFSDVVDVAGQMERLIANLLTMARCEAGSEPVDTSEVELGDLLRRVWLHRKAAADKRGVTLADRVPDGLWVVTDAVKLELILGNVVGNAVEHGPAGSTVETTADVTAGRFRVTVANPAPWIGEDDLDRLFDRFWQKDEARAGIAQHSGLGLPLVRVLCGILGYEVAARLRPDGPLEITIHGPQRIDPRASNTAERGGTGCGPE